MSQLFDSGAKIYAVDFTEVNHRLNEQKSVPKSGELSAEFSQQLVEIIKTLGTCTAELRTAVEDTKIYSMFQKKWYKIVFDNSAEMIDAATSTQFQNFKVHSPLFRGSVSRKSLATLKKVDELYKYVQDHEAAVKANLADLWATPEAPKLVFSLDEASVQKSSSLILGEPPTHASAGKLVSATGEDLPSSTKPKREPKVKLNELQKEEGYFYADYRSYEDLSRELVKGVYKAKQSGLDLVILTRQTEVLSAR